MWCTYVLEEEPIFFFLADLRLRYSAQKKFGQSLRRGSSIFGFCKPFLVFAIRHWPRTLCRGNSAFALSPHWMIRGVLPESNAYESYRTSRYATDQPVGTQRVRTQSAFIPGSAQVGLPEGAYEFLFEVRSNIRPPQTHPRFRNPLGGYGIFRSRLRT